MKHGFSILIFLFISFISLKGYAVPHPQSILKILHGDVMIRPSSNELCKVKIKHGNITHYSNVMNCMQLQRYISRKLSAYPSDKKTVLTIHAPENFPLNIRVQKGSIRSYRKNSMNDMFKVAKGPIFIQDHPDHFETQQNPGLHVNLKTALEEIELTLPSSK